MKNLSLVGCGNMGEAILAGIIKSNLISKDNISIFEPNREKALSFKEKYGINLVESSLEATKASDIIILAVKPNIYPLVLHEIKETNLDNKIIVSIAAGVAISDMEDIIGRKKIVRTMPNTPALVGEAVTSIACNEAVEESEKEFIISLFSSLGVAKELPEKLFSSVIAVSGSSPAYSYMFIEALADGAVLGGMPRDLAYEFAAQAVLGAAKMVLETGEHPAKLKDNVCSPGGTTIEAVAALEESGFRNSVIYAMKKCMEKSKKMEEK